MKKAPQIRDFAHPIADRISMRINRLLRLVLDAWHLREIATEERCRSILVCTGEPYDVPVAYLASRLSRIPLFLYYFDYYSEQWAGTPYHQFAETVERKVIRRADGIIVPNEKMRDELKERYGVTSTIVRNPVSITHRTANGRDNWPMRSDEIRIVYTGSIYRAQADAFRTLLFSLDAFSQLNVTLHIYTAQTEEELARQSIVGPYVLHPYASPSVIEEVQREADILYLPLSFDPELSKVIDTSSPGKMGEYLMSGRPILVHAPPTSFVSEFFKEYDCGLVIDQNDPECLTRGITSLILDENLQARLVGRALDRARIDFSPGNCRNALLDLLNKPDPNIVVK